MTLLLSSPLLLLAFASWVDLRARVVPDAIPVALLAWAVLVRAAGWDAVSWGQAGLGLVVTFAVTALLFRCGVMGGGDGKLLSALGALVGWPGIGVVALGTAVAGGLMAAIVLLRERVVGRERPDELPYVPAMMLGLAWAWWTDAWPLAEGAT